MSDVCLILEGTYPYVSGGVSSWVHRLIQDLPHLQFSVVHLAAGESSIHEYKYGIPSNVTEIRDLFLHNEGLDASARPVQGLPERFWPDLQAFLEAARAGDPGAFGPLYRSLLDAYPDGFPALGLMAGDAAWDFLLAQYRRLPDPVSFNDYFWTWRFTHLPMLRLLNAPLPHACIYHAVSTGYAGFLASLAKLRSGAPMLLTEHGIYTRERAIEIAQSEWVYTEELTGVVQDDFFRNWWNRIFGFFSLMTYRSADAIVTLFEGNRRIQIAEGAPPEKTLLIPNGIDLTRYSALAPGPRRPGTFVVGYVGRIVAIKDLKTLIRAAQILLDRIPGFELWMLGPDDAEPEYTQEIIQMIDAFELTDAVRLIGKVDVMEYYSRFDVLVLTSLSEGQPLVILEGMACGIPVVATDVGACRELIEGAEAPDRALGPAGIVTPVARPDLTARAIETLSRDPGRRAQMGQSGRRRVDQRYRIERVGARYMDLYERFLTLT